MQWWAWIAVGTILLGSELAFVDTQFYLVFVGAAALVVGALDLARLATAAWAQWLLFAALAIGSLVGFRGRIYERMRRRLPVVPDGPVAEWLTLGATLRAGETCRVEWRGSSWDARNDGPAEIPAGARARVTRVDGLTLVVHLDG